MHDVQVPIQPLHDPLWQQSGISVFMQREDLVHPTLTGNKWYKLKYNLQAAKAQGHHTLLTFGGAYSNHIYATAAAGQAFGFHTIGLVRGEKTLPLNYTLQQAAGFGMQLEYVDRATYRHKDEDDFISELRQQYGLFYLLPEGGTNLLAVQGCVEMGRHVADYDYVCLAAGTGGSLAGMAVAMQNQGHLLGFPALKNAGFLYEEVEQLTQAYAGKKFSNLQLINDYHFGGYAKFKAPLIDFINHFSDTHHIALDPVYTGKMLFGLYDLVEKGYFSKGSRVLVIHSGGLQGINGYNERYQHKQLPLLQLI